MQCWQPPRSTWGAVPTLNFFRLIMELYPLVKTSWKPSLTLSSTMSFVSLPSSYGSMRNLAFRRNTEYTLREFAQSDDNASDFQQEAIIQT